MKGSVKIEKIKTLVLLVGLIVFSLLANAYQFNNWRVSNPKNITYYVKPSDSIATSTEINAVASAVPSWQTYCPELKMSRTDTINASMIFAFYLDIDNDTYATAYSTKEVAFYKSWKGLSLLRKQETAVHEAGHLLGLVHCQSQYEAESVMRALDFNDVAHPLADDKRGIAVLY